MNIGKIRLQYIHKIDENGKLVSKVDAYKNNFSAKYNLSLFLMDLHGDRDFFNEQKREEYEKKVKEGKNCVYIEFGKDIYLIGSHKQLKQYGNESDKQG